MQNGLSLYDVFVILVACLAILFGWPLAGWLFEVIGERMQARADHPPVMSRGAAQALRDRAAVVLENDPTTTTTMPTNRVALPQNDINAALRQQYGNNADVIAIQVRTLALIIAESDDKAFANGKVPRVRAIKRIWGESAGSTNARYQALVAALDEELRKVKAPASEPTVTPIAGRTTYARFEHEG